MCPPARQYAVLVSSQIAKTGRPTFNHGNLRMVSADGLSFGFLLSNDFVRSRSSGENYNILVSTEKRAFDA